MNPRLAETIRVRARGRCEYCRLPQDAFPLPFQIDHIRAGKHGGLPVMENLALACTHCNRHMGPNIAGFDGETGETVRLYHPRSDVWSDHFEQSGVRVIGKTAVGRATVDVRRMNSDDQLRVRYALSKEE